MTTQASNGPQHSREPRHSQRRQRSRRCTAITADGRPCRGWAMRGSEPPRCNNHAGWPAPDVAEATEAGGADDAGPQPLPAGPELATINDVVADLAEKQSRLSAFIDLHLPKLSVASLARLLALHGQNASRLGRLLRDQRALSGEASDGIAGAIAQALDELANELGDDV